MIMPADLLAPLGSLEEETFGLTSSDLNARLQQYIADGASRATSDEAVLAWAYYRAYSAAAEIWASQPASGSLQGLGSVAVGGGQYKYFASKAAEYLDRFTGLTAVSSVSSKKTTQNTATTFVW
jgi:hypothetical protein